jgi:ComEC/Rec2-related protein
MRDSVLPAPATPWRLTKLAPVLVAAMAGITVAEMWPELRAWLWCAGLTLAVGWFGIDSRRPALLMVVVLSFGLAHALARDGRQAFPLHGRLQAGQRVEVAATGVVTRAPDVRDGVTRFELCLESLRTVNTTDALRARVNVRWRLSAGATGHELGAGDRISVSGWLSAPPRARNPGEFDVARWFERRGLVGELQADWLRIDEAAAVLPVRRAAHRVRGVLAAAITTGLADCPTEAAVIRALVLGLRDDMPDQVDEAFQRSGTLHIFSVSGLHVGLVAVILWRVLTVLRVARRPAAWASIPLVLFYALVTGWQPAAVRSALMAVVVLAGIGLNRPPSFFNSLCLAGLLILAGDTQQLFMAGAQLSFVVIAGLAAAGPPLAQRMQAWVRPDPFLPTLLWPWWWRWGRPAWEWLAQMLAVSLAALSASTPLTLWHFQLATPVSLLANLIHVPLAGAILATAGLSAAAGACQPVAAVFTHANFAFARVCIVTAEWFGTMPAAAVRWNPRNAGDTGVACRITVFDVGDGGATLIRTPQGRAWLIDTGRPGAFRSVVAPGLAWYGIGRLDGLILSHGDHDHVGGAVEAWAWASPTIVGHSPQPPRSPALQAALALAYPAVRTLAAGDVIALDGATTLSVLWPPRHASLPLADDACLVLRLDCAGRSVVFSNDAGFLAERGISQARQDLSADVWVRGHHASDLSGQEDFVTRLSPALVVNAGRPKPAGSQPNDAWRRMVEATGAAVCNQAETGAVDITLHADGRLAWSTFLE